MKPGTRPPENRELSPLELPIIILYSLIGDSVSKNPVHVQTTGTEAYNKQHQIKSMN